MTTHRSIINCDAVRLRHLEDVLAAVREIGSAEFDAANRWIVAEFTVGEKDGIEDLWELRGLIEEMNIRLEDYGDEFGTYPRIIKPTPVTED